MKISYFFKSNFNFTFKGIIAFLFFSMFLVKANAQPELEEFNGVLTPKYESDLLFVSDRKMPIQDGMCRKLVSEITTGKRGTWARYYFVDEPMEGQWYKDIVFLKPMTPNVYYNEHRVAIYDVANEKYWHFIDRIYGNIYMHLIDDVPDPVQDYYYFYCVNNIFRISYVSKRYKKPFYVSSLVTKDSTFLTYVTEDDAQPLYYYRFKNADYISDMIPDNDVNTKANYLFLQRDYKLGQKYNTLIFPVDVPIKDYNHLYNNGKNKLVVYRLNAIEANALHFVRDISGVLKANVPYIIKSENNDNTTANDIVSERYLTEQPVDSFDINCTKKVCQNNDVCVFAQYRQYLVQDNEYISPDYDYFIVSDNKLLNCRNIGQTRVDRFRWYIRRPSSMSAVPMTMTFDGTTDIDAVNYDSSSDSDDVYDLNGCKVGNTDKLNSLKKGYYVVNGKVRVVGN